jgi:hypothetical protein
MSAKRKLAFAPAQLRGAPKRLCGHGMASAAPRRFDNPKHQTLTFADEPFFMLVK